MSEQDRLKWNEKYAQRPELAPPSTFLTALDDLLPRRGRALDVAGGTGRHALWLAERGLEVTVVDVADEGLRRAAAGAAALGLPLSTVRLDLEEALLPPGPFELIVCFYFLHRPVLEAFPGLLAPGGLLVFAHPTRQNLVRHPRPGAEFLLEEGELPRRVGTLEVLRYQEGWTDDGHHEARMVARKALAARPA